MSRKTDLKSKPPVANLESRPFGSPLVDRDRTELNLLSRYQRGLLFGGGVVLSCVILLAVASGTYGTIREYIARGHAAFLTQQSLLSVEMETLEALFSRTVVSAELLWHSRQHPSTELMRVFSAQGGEAIVQETPSFPPQLVLGQITSGRPAAAFSDYLGLVEDLGHFAAEARHQRGSSISGYLYSPDKSFIALIPAPQRGSTFAAAGVHDTAELIERLQIGLGDLKGSRIGGGQGGSGGVTWFPPWNDPLSGESVLRMAQPAFDKAHPFAIFVGSIPVERLRDRLRQTPSDGELLVIDRSGQVILHSDGAATQADTTLAKRTLQAGSWKAGFDGLSESYHDGIFVVSDVVPGTDWILVYAWSWRTMFAALLPNLIAGAIVTLVMLSLLWFFLLYFDRKVFAPIYTRSQRVFESENLNRTIIAMAPIGLGLFSLERGNVLVENNMMHAYRSKTGGDVPHFDRHLLDVYRQHGNAPDTVPIERELVLELSDNSTRDLLINVIRTRYQGDNVLLCSFSDITERKNIERTQQEARMAADAANAAKSAFLTSMSHEIRTPLNAILGHLELLNRTPHPQAEADRLQTITSSSRMLLDIINDILDFSKIESGQMSLEEVSFDLTAMAEQVVAMFEPIAKAKQLALSLTIEPGTPAYYFGDSTRIRQVIVNLVGNALKFTERGHVDLRMSGRPSVEQFAPLVISVTDTGIGIHPSRQQDIFDAFTQADSSITRRFGGTGLGLTLCKRIVELMGGTITVSSEVGRGTSFRTVLPLRTNQLMAQESAQPALENSVDAKAEALHVHVLIADDHSINRTLIQDQLNALGYTSDAVEDGLAALRVFGTRRYDAVLTDLSMPGMDGYTLAVCLRDQGVTIPIIAITANISTDDHRRCREAGISDILIKPTSLESIDSAIRRSLNHPSRSNTITIPGGDPESRSPLPNAQYVDLQRASNSLLNTARAALEAGSLTTALDQIHSIKGSFAMIHEREVVSACEHIERLGAQGDTAGLADALSAFSALLEATLARRGPTSAPSSDVATLPTTGL
ncbi:ATP-binding protein [Burkholderia ubonensis]|uniref:ATP-binding protein n=1 Tax=Burkholderia ubonensis TaxID=101571 RepID=UPI0009B2ECC4|nr:ATP-binding protein [Burkholderia ubonensis]